MLVYEYSLEDELEVRFEEGIEIGEEIVEERGIIKSAKKMLNSGIQLSRVIEILDLSSEHVEQLDSVVV
jgi:predicted transposase/invertase (TIGR01784 family)